MLSAQKENEHLSQDLRLSAWAKVVGSLEGLRHKLDDLTIRNIDEAQDKVKTLNLRLSELQRTLDGIVSIREQLVNVDAAKAEVDAKTLGFTELDNIQMPLQLHTLRQLRKLILLTRVNRATADFKGSAAKGSSEIAGEPHSNKQRTDFHSLNTLSPRGHVDPTGIPSDSSTDLSVEYEWRQSLVHVNEVTAEERAETEQWPSLSVDNVFLVEEPQSHPSQHEDPHESASIPAQYKPAVTDDNGAKVDPQDKAHPSTFISSETQTGSGFEFDQRLLNDLIKDYGEFVIPSPPANTEEPAASLAPVQSSEAKAQAEFPLVENVTTQKTLPPVRQEGDLDRKLKKLIKDYGEYDLYSDHTSKKYRAGAVAAFTILGVILAGIYFFSPTQNETSMTSSPATRSDSTTTADQPGKREATIGTESKAATRLNRDVPDQSDIDGVPGLGNKTSASKSKNNEKVGN